MGTRSLQLRFTLFLAAFTLLLAASATLTLRVLADQASDAALINLAGRQRMLTQRIAWLAAVHPEAAELGALMRSFETNLAALRDGGPASGARGEPIELPAAPDEKLRSQLDGVAGTWSRFSAAVAAGDLPALDVESQRIVGELDSVVSGFEDRAEAKVTAARRTQTAFLLLGVALLGAGAFLMRTRLFTPLRSLAEAARRMGAGDLGEGVPVGKDDELGDVGAALEGMRREVAEARANLEAQVGQRTRELVSAFEFTQEIVAEPRLDEILQSVVERAKSLGQASSASLCLLEDDGSTLILMAGSPDRPPTPRRRQGVGEGYPADVLRSQEALLIDAACGACAYDTTTRPGTRAAASLRVGERILGALCVVRDEGAAFGAAEQRSFSLLANAAALAILNYRLFEEASRRAEGEARQAERERLAAEFHDHLAQTLAAMQLTAERQGRFLRDGEAVAAEAERLELTQILRRAQDDVRAALRGLLRADRGRPPLADALAHLAREAGDRIGVPVETSIDPEAAARLPRVSQAQLVHIAREGLTNIERHARPTHVRLSLGTCDGGVELVVEDDGQGFDPHSISRHDHHGLTLMRLRAERSGGSFRITSVPGSGARLEARFPSTLTEAGR